ncbi:MAG: AMP-dependent synthetase [Deltaproteobacteria bacterium RIFOXYC2_FULL_48_10]|nr:MAG: AMP-dependent synthetase [Deltaproteobacteria bacterium RIFOXYC2_FULL_48_10]
MIITEILARNAWMYKDRIALVERAPAIDTRKAMTWEQFFRASNKLAHNLDQYGIKKGDKIVQLMTNCLEWLPIYFGILSTGAWVVPLNFRFESDKILLCTQTAEAKVFIFGEEFIDRIEAVQKELETHVRLWIYSGPPSTCPDWAVQYESFIEPGSGDSPPKVELSIDDDAALYFTSGTTGSPKAVLLTHRNLEHACYVEHAHHSQTIDDVFLCIPPLYHTGAKMHWMGSFLVGGKGVLLKGVSPRWIIEAVSEEGCTIVWLLVPWIHDIIIAVENKDIDLSKFTLSQWRLMHAGAQPVPPSLIEHWKNYFPHQDYDTNYGLTESTGPGCIHLGIENAHRIGPIGLPGFDWEAKIVDKDGELLFGNESGELIIKGPGVMKEYYKNPEATAHTLKEGWLKTGDIARYDKDGFIWLVDRKKDMIVTGGENVYSTEVENTLYLHEAVLECAVVGIPDEKWGEAVHACVVLKPGMDATGYELISFCKERIARYKAPKSIEFIFSLPKTGSGKIEKKKLRERHWSDQLKKI